MADVAALTPSAIAQLVRQAGVTDTEPMATLVAIALASSGGDPARVEPARPPEFTLPRRGLFTINDSYGLDQRRLVTDAFYATRCAVEISEWGTRFDAWKVYRTGGYLKYMNAARVGVAQSASIVGSVLDDNGSYRATPLGPMPVIVPQARSNNAGKAGFVRAEDGSYVPANYWADANTSYEYKLAKGQVAATRAGVVRPLVASYERPGQPLAGLRITGTEITGDFGSSIIGDASYESGFGEIPNLSFTIADPEGDLLWQKRNLWVSGTRVEYLDLDLRIDEIKFAPGGHTTGQIEVTAIDAMVYALQRLRGARTDKNVSPTAFIRREIQLAGFDPDRYFLGEQMPTQAQISRDVPDQNNTSGSSGGDVPSAWTTCVRLAKETGKRLFICGRKMIYGSVAFAQAWASPGYLRLGWHGTPDGERWLTLPSKTDTSSGSNTGGTEVSGLVPLERARYFRPGVEVIVARTPSIAAGDRKFICSKISHTLGTDVSGAEITLVEPIDVKPETKK